MKVTHTEPAKANDKAKIEIGESSWKDGTKSIRLRWDREGGGFDPISSSELPVWGLKELVLTAASQRLLTPDDVTELIKELVTILRHQIPSV